MPWLYLSRYTTSVKAVAELLRGARRQAHLTQAELAARAGTSQSAIARYENAAVVPTHATLERLMAACGRRLTLASEPEPAQGTAGASELRKQRRALLALARRHGARNLRIFGSAARGDGGPESDVDLLVDLETGRTLLDLIALRREASELLGRRVDVATREMLRDSVLRNADRDAVPL